MEELNLMHLNKRKKGCSQTVYLSTQAVWHKLSLADMQTIYTTYSEPIQLLK